jgi:hypothetical protein
MLCLARVYTFTLNSCLDLFHQDEDTFYRHIILLGRHCTPVPLYIPKIERITLAGPEKTPLSTS